MDVLRFSTLLKTRLPTGWQLRLFGGSRFDADPYMSRDYRRKNILHKRMNQYQVMMEGPDYTFNDGRPTPYGSRQLARFQKQREYTGKIIKLTREVDAARSTHKRHLLEKSAEVNQILNSKLKSKGQITLE